MKDISLEIEQGEFVVICGESGSGKSTLLRHLKPELTPKGKMEGEILFFGKSRNEFSLKESASDIGFLLQNTEYSPPSRCSEWGLSDFSAVLFFTKKAMPQAVSP
ncbi:MAG: ATP-binding cassette domain-containing protein [Clostridia bacterium]|nr:ATP-binding cassette domain-containing protein [Clostridia bacterium]